MSQNAPIYFPERNLELNSDILRFIFYFSKYKLGLTIRETLRSDIYMHYKANICLLILLKAFGYLNTQ